jgi:hypothetical protein
MTAPATDKQALDLALEAFRHTLPDTLEANDIEHVFSSFQYLAEPVVGIALQRVLEFFQTSELPADFRTGHALVTLAEDTSEPDEERKEYLIAMSGSTYVLTSAPRRQQRGDAEKGIRQIVLSGVADDDYRSRLASATAWTKDGDNLSLGSCRMENFSGFMDFMDGIRGDMEHYLRETVGRFDPMEDGKMRHSAFRSLAQQYLVDRDGGLPGRLCREAAGAIIEGGSARICDYIASVLPEIVASATARGIVWGEAFLEYNDLDNNVTALPTDVSGRSALYHRNTSLIFDHNAFVVWADHDSAGRLVELSAVALQPGDDRLRATVAAVAAGVTPEDEILLRYRPARDVFEHEAFFATGMLPSMGHYVAYDFEEMVEGQMEDSEDSKIITDFEKIFSDEDCDAGVTP